MLIFRLFLASLVSAAAVSVSQVQNCDCRSILSRSIEAVSVNYSLFKIKVTPANEQHYQAFNRLYLEKASGIKTSSVCQILMDNWVKYFNDKHLWVTVAPSTEKVSYSSLPLDLVQAKKRWADRKVVKDSIEGLWEMEGYRAAILPDAYRYGHFNAVIVSADNPTFKRGMLKMHLSKREGRYEMDFYRRDSTMVSSSIRFSGVHTLVDEDGLVWRRIEPVGSNDKVPTLAQLEAIDANRPTLTWKDTKTALIELPSCAPRYARVVDSLVESNKKRLQQADRLIVDVRHNGGGSDRTYRALLPFILTEPVGMPKVGYYMSEENIKVFKENGTFKNLAAGDTLLRDTLLTTTASSSLSAPEYHENPKKVAILMGPKTASSGETFVWKSKKSPRVITYGQATAGCIDGYNGNIIDVGGATLRYPTSVRTLNLPMEAIDPFGILPDVPVSCTGGEAVSFVIEHLKLLTDKEVEERRP